jgi:RimJ/RimL family protein N-acetyltransferase
VSTLETDRLLMRPYGLGDEPAYLDMVQDPEVMRHLPGGQPMTPDQGRAAFQRRLAGADPQRHHFALVEKATGHVVGWAGLMRLESTSDTEVYYGLRRDAWGKGYATEAARRLVRWGFEDLHLPRVVAVVDPANVRSGAVLQRLGMRFERVGHHYGKMLDVHVLAPAAAAPPIALAPEPVAVSAPLLAWSAPLPPRPPLPPPAPVAAPAFCAACGSALAHGASFCSRCGRPVAAVPAVAAPPSHAPPTQGLAPPPPYAAHPPQVSQGIAIAALLLNVFIWPGLGSLVAEQKVGWAQGFLFLGGFVVLVGTFGLGFVISIAMWVGAWVWGIITGIQLLSGRPV